jgi:hypothetical protein
MEVVLGDLFERLELIDAGVVDENFVAAQRQSDRVLQGN